jgi:hypothetical protein
VFVTAAAGINRHSGAVELIRLHPGVMAARLDPGVMAARFRSKQNLRPLDFAANHSAAACADRANNDTSH